MPIIVRAPEADHRKQRFLETCVAKAHLRLPGSTRQATQQKGSPTLAIAHRQKPLRRPDRRCALRGRVHCDAPGASGVASSRRRPGQTWKRHAIDPRAHARRRAPAASVMPHRFRRRSPDPTTARHAAPSVACTSFRPSGIASHSTPQRSSHSFRCSISMRRSPPSSRRPRRWKPSSHRRHRPKF